MRLCIVDQKDCADVQDVNDSVQIVGVMVVWWA